MEIEVYSRGFHNLYYNINRGLRAVVQLGQDCSTLVDVEHHWSVHQLHLKEMETPTCQAQGAYL